MPFLTRADEKMMAHHMVQDNKVSILREKASLTPKVNLTELNDSAKEFYRNTKGQLLNST